MCKVCFLPRGRVGSSESTLCAQHGCQCTPLAPCRAGCQQGGPRLGLGSPSHKGWPCQEVTRVPRQVRSTRTASPSPPLLSGLARSPWPLPSPPLLPLLPSLQELDPGMPECPPAGTRSPLCHAPRHSRSDGLTVLTPLQAQTLSLGRGQEPGLFLSEDPGPGLRLGAIVIIRLCLLNK